jgi:hypothetical protein
MLDETPQHLSVAENRRRALARFAEGERSRRASFAPPAPNASTGY